MSELGSITRHAGTVLAGQLAVMAFGVADTLIAGRFSSEALAALSVGSAIYISIFIALNGVLQAQLPVWAELRGAGREAEVGRSVRQALYLAFVAMALGVTALLLPGPLMRWTEVPPAMQAAVQDYLAILALAVPPSLLFRMYATLNQSLGWPLLVTWVQIGSLGVKVPLSIWLTFGGLGVPAMGLAGCAWATLIVAYLMFGLAAWMLGTQAMYRPYRIWHRLERPDWPTKGRPRARCTVNAQLGAMALQHMLDDGQAQAGTPGFAGTAAVHAVKTLGQARDVLGAMPGPVSVTENSAAPVGQQLPAHINADPRACSAWHCSPGWTWR
jgi:MATE family multidrug resistance protein